MKNNNAYFYSRGKLLITGEYLVLEGAIALALPINKGQSLTITELKNSNILNWNAKHIDGQWFNTKLNLPQLEIIETDNIEISKRLQRILSTTKEISPEFLSNNNIGFDVVTNLEFHPKHGFGSSSTLINNIAQWAKTDAFYLQQETFSGSGYDIACAKTKSPIFYQLINGKPIVNEVNFKPVFSKNIYFVYLGQKQNSFESISDFKQNAKFSINDIDEISNISKSIVNCSNLTEFEYLINNHESLIAKVINRTTIKSILFNNFPGSVKSLGGWGGDFVMMTTDWNKNELSEFLFKKGLNTFYQFDELTF